MTANDNLITHAVACTVFDVDVKRLRGWIYNGYSSIHYPIGDETYVDSKSLETFLKRRADRASADPFTAVHSSDVQSP